MVMCFLSVFGHVAFKIIEAPLVHLENCRKSGNVKIIILVTWVCTCEAQCDVRNCKLEQFCARNYPGLLLLCDVVKI